MRGASPSHRGLRLAAGLAALAAASCSQTPDAVPLRSLERSGKIALLCLDLGSTGQVGYSLEDCQARRRANKPGGSDTRNKPPTVTEVKLYALVNQTTRGEVALLDVPDTVVVDTDATSPGFDFLPVGAQPVDIVVTPESTAAFVASAEINRPGIYALPTDRLTKAPSLLSWPACALPGRPGAMTMLVAPGAGLCGGANYAVDTLGEVRDRAHPGGDLSIEQQRPGARKLLVTLPTEGEMLVIDAQALLDRAPGTFDVCPIERRYPLTSEAPDQIELTGEPDPADVCPPRPRVNAVAGSVCPVQQPRTVDSPVTSKSSPVALAQADGVVYIADRGAPVIHRYDMNDPCSPVPLPPLLPTSFDQPWRTVTTRSVAISPITSTDQRFLYAVDDGDGSAMVFDVGSSGAERTPLVRNRPEYFPFSARDRLNLGAPIQDLTFVQQDFYPYDSNGTKVPGVRCDPGPAADGTTPGSTYRASADLTTGATPTRLRGVFGVAALTSGQVVIVDVDDYDADCRRASGSTLLPDWVTGCDDTLACAPDGSNCSCQSSNDAHPNASGEGTCRAVVPHEVRSRNSIATLPNIGRHEPSMGSFPQLSLDGVTLATDADTNPDAAQYPKLLGPLNPRSDGTGDRPDGGRWVFTSDGVTQLGVGDPTPPTANLNFVVADTREPRASIDQAWALTYEGIIAGTAGKIGQLALDPVTSAPAPVPDPDQPGTNKPDTDQARSDRRGLSDPSGNFCYLGIHDEKTAELEARRLSPQSDAERLRSFARSHADWVEITNELLDEDDPYWDGNLACNFARCRVTFGTATSPTPARSFRIHKAYNDRLLLRGDSELPRGFDAATDNDLDDDLYPDALTVKDLTGGEPLDPGCCFPKQVTYQVRGGQTWIAAGSVSGFLQHTTIGADGRCTLLGVDASSGEVCDESLLARTGRAYEFGTLEGVNGRWPTARPYLDPTSTTQAPTPDRYLFKNPYFSTFVYRGSQPSRRNMSFGWTMAGGFQPLEINVGRGSTQVAPQSLVYHPALGAEILVTDGALQGVLSIDLFSFVISKNFL